MSDPHAPTQSLALSQPHRGPTLVALWEGGAARYPLDASRAVVVGRGDDCDLQILHPALSRRHFRLRLEPTPSVEDLGSKHGTRVAGRELKAATAPLPPGGIIEAQGVTLFVHEPEASTTVVAPNELDRERMLKLVAASDLSVVLFGETGVGKDVAAEQLHAASPRAKGPLIKINCAALPEQLLESELFGHEKGAFTGADRQKPGLIEAANRGTLFLDEVTELTAATQAKLLQVLETRQVRRVGAVASHPVDVRLVSATSQELTALIRAKRFRDDLYYRLNGMTLKLPPLRERLHELPVLVRNVLARLSPDTPVKVGPDLVARLALHRWPGNVRELKNVLHRALVLADGKPLEPKHIVLDVPEPGEPPATTDLKSTVDAFERQRVVEALEAAGGNQTKAAELLGITRRALIVRLDQYELPRPRRK